MRESGAAYARENRVCVTSNSGEERGILFRNTPDRARGAHHGFLTGLSNYLQVLIQR